MLLIWVSILSCPSNQQPRFFTLLDGAVLLSPTFHWTSDKDYTLVWFLETYLYKSGSKLVGQKWKEVADNFDCLQPFKDSPRDQRSFRERFQKIIDLFKAKIRKEEAAIGISPEPLTETEQLAMEIVEIMDKLSNSGFLQCFSL